MPIENPSHLVGCTTPSCADKETLKSSAPGNEALASRPAMDMTSVQRPDKAACPRCQSLDTKFCYFNNYSSKQPRHFCRRCQRYWTDGGSLRNVPVGAGRRKQKNPLNSTAPKLYSEGDGGLMLPHFSAIASGLLYPSNKSPDFLSAAHMDGPQPHSFQHVSDMSTYERDCHSRLNVCEGTQAAMVQKLETRSDTSPEESSLSCLHHDVGNEEGGFFGLERGPVHIQQTGKSPLSEGSSRFHDDKVEDRVTPSSSLLPSHRNIEEADSSSSANTAVDEKKDIVHPFAWLEQFAKAQASFTSGYGYSHASSAWTPPYMWPWLLPCATNNGPAYSNVDQAAVSAVWASAVTATAANILQSSHMWNHHGWGTMPMSKNKPEELSSLGKRARSSSHEQEPLCIPKTLKIGHPQEAMHSSILMTLGLSGLSTSSPATATGFFNAEGQSKADVLPHKPTVQLLPGHLEQLHMNPAAQARSLAFQESS